MNANKQEALDALVEEINKQIEWEEKHNESEESMYAEFAMSFGYHDGQIYLDRIDNEKVKDTLEKLKQNDKKAFWELVGTHISWDLADLHYQDNEVFGVTPGEVELGLDEATVAFLQALTAEEFDYIRSSVDAYLDDKDDRRYVYLNMSGVRHVVILDVDAVAQELGITTEVEA